MRLTSYAWSACLLVLALPHPAPARGPELYGIGLFTTGAWDFFMAFSPDQRTVLFCHADDKFETYEILETRRNGRTWSAPAHPSFAAGGWSDADPHFSPDGRRLFFISNRPTAPGAPARGWYDIWYVDRAADGGWGTPVHLPPPINGDTLDKWSPSVANNGNLYFGSSRQGTRGETDIWMAPWDGHAYGEPRNLGDSINTAKRETEPWIAPDESYLIFSGSARDGGNAGFDLAASVKRHGVWQGTRPLQGINTAAHEFNQSVSPDGRYLYFSSNRKTQGPFRGPRFDTPSLPANIDGVGNGTGDIYRIPIEEVAELRPIRP